MKKLIYCFLFLIILFISFGLALPTPPAAPSIGDYSNNISNSVSNNLSNSVSKNTSNFGSKNTPSVGLFGNDYFLTYYILGGLFILLVVVFLVYYFVYNKGERYSYGKEDLNVNNIIEKDGKK